jgi:tRNA A37 methylthiotransferase MiaB
VCFVACCSKAHVCTRQAKQESISAIFEAAGYKKDGKARRVIVTGCLAQRYAGELAAELPEARFHPILTLALVASLQAC